MISGSDRERECYKYCETDVTQLTVLSEAEVYIFRGRGVFIDVYKADDKNATSGATSLADINLRRTYRAIDSVATGRIPSLFCGYGLFLYYILYEKMLVVY